MSTEHIPGHQAGNEYAEDYYPEMASLKERIAANQGILENTNNQNEMQLIGKILRRDKQALIDLKIKHNVPLDEDEKLAA
ncbi:MAG: hypothetical protein NUV90_03795 [Candidatus Parcubacteria bacterium]|nr:hypothetical protein [Candidatus Parcubacteria bacterium]